MFENAPCGYITLQTTGRVSRVNKTLLAWTGYVAKDMIGNRFTDFVNMAGRIYYETHIAPLLRMQGFFNEFAIEMVTREGEPVQMICNALEGRDAAGKPLFIRLALLKATDRRRYEQELLAAREAAKTSLASERETSELREQFIAVLGHDLRNPLASISAGARILGRSAQMEREHQVVAMMQTTVMRMADLIDNVLDFARGRLGGGITWIAMPANLSSRCCIMSLTNCGCHRRDARSRLSSRSMFPWIATGPGSGSSLRIWWGMLLHTALLASPCAYARRRARACSGCLLKMGEIQYLRALSISCSSRSFAEKCARAAKGWALACTLLRKSRRPTKACSA